MTERHGATLDQPESGEPEGAPTGTGGGATAFLRTDIASLAERTTEMCVLLACVMVPLYFPGGTAIPADAHKSAPLVAIAAIAAAAWLIAAVESRGTPSRANVFW